jgi:hypothetical protein
MSGLYDTKPYARLVLNKLGYQEHTDPFSKDNVPGPLLDKRYCLSQGQATVWKQNQDNMDLTQPLQVNLHRKGFKQQNAKFQEALAAAEVIRDAMIAPKTRLTQPYIKDVRLLSMEIQALGQTNDHSMLITFVFNVSVLISQRSA